MQQTGSEVEDVVEVTNRRLLFQAVGRLAVQGRLSKQIWAECEAEMKVFPVRALGSWSAGRLSAVQAVQKGVEAVVFGRLSAEGFFMDWTEDGRVGFSLRRFCCQFVT